MLVRRPSGAEDPKSDTLLAPWSGRTGLAEQSIRLRRLLRAEVIAEDQRYDWEENGPQRGGQELGLVLPMVRDQDVCEKGPYRKQEGQDDRYPDDGAVVGLAEARLVTCGFVRLLYFGEDFCSVGVLLVRATRSLLGEFQRHRGQLIRGQPVYPRFCQEFLLSLWVVRGDPRCLLFALFCLVQHFASSFRKGDDLNLPHRELQGIWPETAREPRCSWPQ